MYSPAESACPAASARSASLPGAGNGGTVARAAAPLRSTVQPPSARLCAASRGRCPRCQPGGVVFGKRGPTSPFDVGGAI